MYEVVQVRHEGRERVVEVLARAADTDGLFDDAVAPARERLVLRGCTAPVEALTGDVGLEIRGEPGWQWWRLGDLVVHAELPGGDLVCSASAFQLVGGGEQAGRRYLLRSLDHDTVLGTCRVVEGFPREFDRVWPPVTLIGCDTADFSDSVSPGASQGLRALDRDGRVVAEAGVALDVVSASPSAIGPGLFDVVLDQSRAWNGVTLIGQRPEPAARAVWRTWMKGVPAERNLWAPLDDVGRRWWNEVAANAPRTKPAPGVFHVDGTHATDRHGTHLALSEALVGPGHYLGSVYAVSGMIDHWHLPPGTTVVWHGPSTALAAIPDHFFGLLKHLRDNGVDVILEPSTPDIAERLDQCVELGGLVNRWIAGRSSADEERILAGDADVAAHAEDVGLDYARTWLIVPTHSPDEVTETVRRAGLVLHEPEKFLRSHLPGHAAPEVPAGFEVSVTRGDLIEVRVSRDGVAAASGAIAVVGPDAVPHAVETAHEGLAGVVLGVLARQAVAAGATTGFVCTADEVLYRELGWETVSDVVIASNTKGEA